MGNKAPPNRLVGGQGPVSDLPGVSVIPSLVHTGLNVNRYVRDTDSHQLTRDQLSAYGAGHTYHYYVRSNGWVHIHMPQRFFDRENFDALRGLSSLKAVEGSHKKSPPDFHGKIMAEHSWVVQEFKVDNIDFNNFLAIADSKDWILVDKTSDRSDISTKIVSTIIESVDSLKSKGKNYIHDTTLPLDAEGADQVTAILEEVDSLISSVSDAATDIAERLVWGKYTDHENILRRNIFESVVHQRRRLEKLRDTLSTLFLYKDRYESLEEDIAALRKKYPVLNCLEVDRGNPVLVLPFGRITLNKDTGIVGFEPNIRGERSPEAQAIAQHIEVGDRVLPPN